MLEELGCNAMGLHSLSSCVLLAETLRLPGENGRKIDLGLVGKVTEVNAKLLTHAVRRRHIPVIASIAMDRTGGKLNVNADSAAGKVAAAVVAEKLVMVSDTHGIRRDINDPDSWISSLNEKQIKEMIDAGIITDGDVPQGRGVPDRAGGGRQEGPHHRRPDRPFAAAGNLHGKGHRHGDRQESGGQDHECEGQTIGRPQAICGAVILFPFKAFRTDDPFF